MMKKFEFGNLGSPLAVLLLLSLFVLGCRKDRMETLPDDHSSVYVRNAELAQAKQKLSDPLSIQFFDFAYATNANPNVRPLASGRTSEEELLNGVAYELLRLNQAYNFVPRLILRSGFPYWSHAEIFTDENADRPVVLLPFAHLNSDSVEAVLLATPLVDTAGWYTTIYTRKQIDSLLSVTTTDTAGLGFKVVSFIVLDNKLFGNISQAYVDWFTDVFDESDFSGGAQDRCGSIIEWCTEVNIVPHNFDDHHQIRDRDPGRMRCYSFITPCPGAYSGPGASDCWLNENFVWVCDYMLVNWDTNGSGGGGSGENPIIPPGTVPSGDMGTDILNLFNNGQISEEVMNQLLTIHFSMGLTGNDLLVLTAKPEMRDVLAEFILINAGNVNPLTPAEIRAVWNFAIQYDLTPEQFRTLLMNRALFQQVKALTERLNLNKEELGLLISQPLFVTQVTNFLQAHQGVDVAELFADYMIQELSTDPSVPKDTDLSQYNFFDNFEPVINYLESNTESEDEFDNGIELDYIIQAPPSPPSAGRLLGGAPANPNGGQDAIGRTNGDLNILPSPLRIFDSDPEGVLKFRMRLLFFLATNSDQEEILDGMGDAVSNAYLSKFFSNKNGTFHPYQNSTLHQMVKESPKFKNWLKNYGDKLNQKLKLSNGNIAAVNDVTFDRTALNTTKSLTILINDTQKTDVYIVEDQYDFHLLSGDWEAVVRVNITDNFGVDDGDVTEFWNHVPGGPGFTSWWMLQHRKNYWPFKTDLWFTVKIKGNINN